MDNIFEWANSLTKNQKSKPPASLQTELFNRISTVIEGDSPSYSDCVKALVKFDKKVLEPFYRECYAGFSPEQQRAWDKALRDWADDVRPAKNATIRIVPILRCKLQMTDDISKLEHELRWLSLHEDERSVQEFIQLRDRTDESDLQKLLSLDLSQWRAGRVQIEKMYSILFSESTNETTRKLYEAFLSRIGKAPSKEAEFSAPIQDKPAEPLADAPQSIAGQAKAKPDDGIALAQALLEWSKGINERCLSQARQIADLQAENQKSAKRIVELESELRDMGNTLSETQSTLRLRDGELQEAHAQIEAIQEKASEARDTIGRIQHMSNNSIRQELDGFKHALSGELKKTVVDFGKDYSDLSAEEQVEVYKAFFEEMLDTLKHNGIVIEEN